MSFASGAALRSKEPFFRAGDLTQYLRFLRRCMSPRLARGDRASAGSSPDGSMPLSGEEPITAIPAPPAADPLKVALGEQLFADKRLSHDGTLACLSCHDTRTNGTRSAGRGAAPTVAKTLRTLSVFDAALNFRLNWEGNFRTLEAQTNRRWRIPPIWRQARPRSWKSSKPTRK